MTLAAQTTNGSASGTTGSEQSITPQTPTETNIVVRSSRRSILPPDGVRLVLGLLLLASAASAYSLTESGLEAERFRYLTISLAGLSLVVALFETIQNLLTRDRFTNPLSLFPAAGVVLISLGAALSTALGQSSPRWVLSVGPAMAAGFFLLLRAGIVRFCNRPLESESLLFPQEGAVTPVTVGKRYTLTPGMVAPADSRVEAGSCSILERYLSSESHFRIKDETDIIFAGSQVLGGQAEVTALSGFDDSCLRSLERLIAPGLTHVENSLPAEDNNARLATAYLLLFVSVAAAILWDERSGKIWETLCAAGLVFYAAMVLELGEFLFAARRALARRWARAGLLITSQKGIRDLCHVTKILFDPSRIDAGSLIEARELEILDDRVGRVELCQCLGALFGRSDDAALAAAGDLCQRIAGTISPDRVLSLQEYPGRGVSGSVKGVPVTVGTEELLVERGILIHPSESNVEGAADERPLLVAIGGELVARFWIKFGQAALFTEGASEVREGWSRDVQPVVSAGTTGEIQDGTLLVRGAESSVLGRDSAMQLDFFSGDRFELPHATVVALTPKLYLLPLLLRECQHHCRLVERGRVLIAFGTFVAVSVVFLGFFSPVVAAGASLVVAALLLLL